jgi:ribosome maturation factor RimP
MHQAPAKIQAVVAPVVTSLGYELVGVEYLAQGRGGLLRVYIDSEDGITLDDCSRVSHQLSGVLDVEDVIRGQYQLEISSPGLDRPLFSEAQFARFIGHQVKLKLTVPVAGRRKFRGVIEAVKEGVVTLAEDGELKEIAFNNIDKANLVPEF